MFTDNDPPAAIIPKGRIVWIKTSILTSLPSLVFRSDFAANALSHSIKIKDILECNLTDSPTEDGPKCGPLCGVGFVEK